MLTRLGSVTENGKVTYWNWDLICVLTDDGEAVRLDFASDHALRFVGEARLGVLRSLGEMGLNVIDIKPVTPMAAKNVEEEPAT